MDKVAILIPCYNEEKTIEKVVNDFKKHLDGAKIYVYDNNSTDKTAELAKKAGAIVRHEYAQGKGNVIRRMFREINAEVYIMVDGDATYSAKDAPAMIEMIKGKKAEMVVGDRLSGAYYTENKRPFHNFGNNLVRGFVNKIFRANISDIMTGYRAMSYEFVKTFPVLSQGFEIETEMSIHAAFRRMRTENITITYKDRPEGSESKLSTFSDGFKVLRTILYLIITYKPLQFFCTIATILTAIGIGLFVPILIEYFNTKLVPRIPTLIVASFLLLIALLFYVIGFYSKMSLVRDAREFEYKLVTVTLLKAKL
ncbi:glycosyltransferase [Candidatus Saccharibacteria bacterium]|nr:glycosyltransferase [Candidatus Saccharibacteria bacterium]